MGLSPGLVPGGFLEARASNKPMNYEKKVKAKFRYSTCHSDDGIMWQVFEGNPHDLYEIGFGSTPRQAWKNAWERYRQRKALVDRLYDFTPTHTNH